MQLPQFIQRALDFFTKAESHFKAEQDLAAANTTIAQLTVKAKKAECDMCGGTGKVDGKKCAECDGTGEAKAAQISLRAQLTQAKKDGETKAEEIKITQGKVETEKKRANETLAAQGITADQIPPGEQTAGVQQPKETAWEKYERLRAENPRAAGQFWLESKGEILKARPTK